MRTLKIVCPFLSFLLLCGCGDTGLTINDSTKQEIGETTQTLAMEDTYLKSVQYPQTSIAEIDDKVKQVVQTYEDNFMMQVEAAASQQVPEFNITYESYVKDDRYVSILLLIYEKIEDTQTYCETMVFDNKDKKWMTLEDVVSMDSDVLSYLSREAISYFKERYPGECSNDAFRTHTSAAIQNFTNFILRKDGIVFYYDNNTIFDHDTTYSISYDELKPYTAIRNEASKAYVPYDDILNEPTKHIDPDKPMVALTFDDGPSKRYTRSILDALKEYNASATFFVLGSNAERAPDLLQRMVMEGNEIGNHTYSHKQLTTLSKEHIEEEIIATQESIYGITHTYPKLIRPPYGSKNDNVLECANGKRIVTWTLDTRDWQHKDSNTIVRNVCDTVKNGDIILMHDLYASSAQAAVILIPRLQEMGYQLVTVSELYTYYGQP